mmetsp:Transcript_3244/g.11051  ORF Transcript_3244/g.11051 Transcript_3244/m.11051 type:complete len:217 (-) Transcript_3244:370-1020(-)
MCLLLAEDIDDDPFSSSTSPSSLLFFVALSIAALKLLSHSSIASKHSEYSPDSNSTSTSNFVCRIFSISFKVSANRKMLSLLLHVSFTFAVACAALLKLLRLFVLKSTTAFFVSSIVSCNFFVFAIASKNASARSPTRFIITLSTKSKYCPSCSCANTALFATLSSSNDVLLLLLLLLLLSPTKSLTKHGKISSNASLDVKSNSSRKKMDGTELKS